MKKYALLTMIYSVWDISVYFLLHRVAFLKSLEIGFAVVNGVDAPGIAHRLLAFVLMIIPVVSACSHNAKMTRLQNFIAVRYKFSYIREVKFITSSLFISAMRIFCAKMTADMLLCLLFERNSIICALKLDLLFALLVIEVLLVIETLILFGLNRRVALIIFVFISVFLPDLTCRGNALISIPAVASTDYESRFAIEATLKISMVCALYLIYIIKQKKREYL